MTISPELIENAKREIGVEKYYAPSDSITPQHILYKEFINSTKWKALPKLIYYILLQELFPECFGKSERGDLGYSIKLKQEIRREPKP